MTSIKVGLDEELAARLAERAKRAGVRPEDLARAALEEYLADDPGSAEDEIEGSDSFAWFGKYSSEEAQSDRIDTLLTKRFGR